MNKIILASGSPRRRELLEKAGFSFVVEPSSFEEDMAQDMAPEELVKDLSRGKAKDITSQHAGENKIVLGADTVIAFNGEIIGKPTDADDARRILRKLSDEIHSVFTGITIIDAASGTTTSIAEETKMPFEQLTEKMIDDYLLTGEPLDKAGAYGIQAIPRGFVNPEKIEGEVDNAIGLPMKLVTQLLVEAGAKVETQ